MDLRAGLHFAQATTGSTHGNAAFSALIWWLVPLFAVTGAIIYVIWVSRFKDKYESETNRSVSAFQAFQRSFTAPGEDFAEREAGNEPTKPE
jgi:H+/Cl- antiporter ClcA